LIKHNDTYYHRLRVGPLKFKTLEQTIIPIFTIKKDYILLENKSINCFEWFCPKIVKTNRGVTSGEPTKYKNVTLKTGHDFLE